MRIKVVSTRHKVRLTDPSFEKLFLIASLTGDEDLLLGGGDDVVHGRHVRLAVHEPVGLLRLPHGRERAVPVLLQEALA